MPILAASKGRDKIVKLLLDHGANVFLHTEAGLNGTALHFAAGNGHYDCVRYHYNLECVS